MESLQENIQSSTIVEMLNSTCLLLDKKLSMIQLLCTRERYSKLCDHSVIIKWVADILPTLSSQEALKVYNCLNVCLKGNIVPPANGKVFFKMLLSCFMVPNIPQDKQVSSAVRGCLLNILHKPYFQEILKYDISDLSTCIEVYLVTFSFSGVDGRVCEIFSVIRSMYKSTLLKSNFVEEFVESMLPNMFTFIRTDSSYTQQIDFCFQQVLFPDAESASKYLQAFKNYNPNGSTPSNQYDFLVKLIVRKPFICGSPMLSGKFYELFCRRFIAYCKSHLIMTYELFTCMCSILGCKPNINIPLSVETNDYNKELSLHCLNSALVTIQESSQITHTLNMGRSLFVDYITALVDFIVSKSSETCAEFYDFVSNIVRLIPSFSEGVFRKALSVVLLRRKDPDELECYVKMLAEVLKMYSKFYNLGKFVTHLFEETVKALVIAKDNSNIEWEYLLPCTFLTDKFERTAVVMGTDHLCRTLDVVNNLLMDCIAKIQNQKDQTDTETCNFVLQCEMLGKIWCRLFTNCEMPSMVFQSRHSVVTSKVLESVEMAGKVLTVIGKLLLTASPNNKLMSMFLEMSCFWGHASFISDRISKSAVTDLKDLSILCDFLDVQEWAKIVNIVTEIDNEICQTQLTDMLLTNLWCFPTTSARVKKDLIQNIISTASVEWLWENYNNLLENATQRQLAIICERLASEDSIDVLLQIKLLFVEKLSELRTTNFFLPVYIMKTAGKLLSAEGRNLTLSVSSLLTTEFLLAEVKRRYVARSSTSNGDVAETMITMISDRIHESADGQCEKRTIAYLEEAFELLQGMSLYSLERHFRLSLFGVLVALCKDLEKNKLLQDKAFSLMLDVLVGSCKCQKNMQGPCSNCGSYLHLPGKTNYSSILKWLFLESKEHENHIDLIDHLCGTISRDADLTERTVDSLQLNLELICSFHKVLSKSAVLTADGSVNKKRKRKLIRTSNDEIIEKCFTYMTDGVLKVVTDETTSPQQGTLVAYTLALQRAIQTRNGNLQILLQRLNAYWELLGLCIRENPKFVTQDEVAFVSILLKNRGILNHALPEDFIRQVWERLQSVKISTFRTPLVVLCLCVTEINEYKWIVETLCNRLKICELNEVADMAMLWSLIAEVHVSAKKLIILGDGLITACREFTRLSKLMTSSSFPAICQYKTTIIYFMLTVAKTKQIRITPGMIDEMFEALNDIKPKEPDGIQMGLKLLTTMLHLRTALVVDRIPPFLQRFRFLMTTVAAICHVSEKSPTQVWLPYVKSAYQVERLSQKIVQHVNDFARVAPNIICHLMSCLEKYTLPSVVKMHYMNSVYVFLSICDKHGIEYVNRLMPEPSSEMFKTLYNNYIKFYKFSGNV